MIQRVESRSKPSAAHTEAARRERPTESVEAPGRDGSQDSDSREWSNALDEVQGIVHDVSGLLAIRAAKAKAAVRRAIVIAGVALLAAVALVALAIALAVEFLQGMHGMMVNAFGLPSWAASLTVALAVPALLAAIVWFRDLRRRTETARRLRKQWAPAEESGT